MGAGEGTLPHTDNTDEGLEKGDGMSRGIDGVHGVIAGKSAIELVEMNQV